MSATAYSRRLGSIEPEQFQAALDRFELGTLISAEAIPFGLFGQNVKLRTSTGEFELRGAAHYNWQFPKERLVASLLHTQTPVAAPWPYLLDLDESIFGWRHGYVLMPRLAGLQLADPKVAARLTKEEQTAIAFAVGKNLRDLQRAESPFAGHYDHELGAFRPLEEEFPDWVAAEIRQSAARCVGRGDITPSDRRWIEARVDEARDELAVPYRPVLVHHDYKEANLTVGLEAGEWKVTGVFDLMEAFFGDGELDLVRQIADYIDRGEDVLAKSFLDGFLLEAPLRPGALRRLGVYLIHDRMIIWDYFHQPEIAGEWWYGEIAVRDWLEGYLASLASLLSESG
jgi:hygromycin-B 7''-O-kinase